MALVFLDQNLDHPQLGGPLAKGTELVPRLRTAGYAGKVSIKSANQATAERAHYRASGADGALDKVLQGGGGIARFPGSHRLLYEAEPDSVDLARYSILHPPHPQSGAAEFVLPQPPGLKDALAEIDPFEFFGDEGDVVLWRGRMFHSATPNYSNPPQIRQMVLYDAYKKSVYDRAYTGRYLKGPRPSPPPNVRKRYGLELGPAAPPPEPRAEGPGLWDDWCESVLTAAATSDAPPR